MLSGEIPLRKRRTVQIVFRVADDSGTASFLDRRAFELSRWRGGRYCVVGPSIVARVRFGSQGGYCDPSQEADAG
jgi:hypothetical protein